LLLVGFLAGCAPLPPAGPVPERPARESIQSYALQARFSIKAGNEGQSGRMAWNHRPEGDKVLFLSPLGQGVATLESDAAGARLDTADGRNMSAASPDELAEQVLGRSLPLRRVPRWVLGLAGPDASLSRDQTGRALEIREDGWRVDYVSYENDKPQALPQLLRISRDDLEMKLRIDAWSLSP
jgi:outer membrane lipoprotein LolB